ncbi:hypothetical protein EZV61_10380 [Corallincola luteus]|uniref:DUF676 domain-containing protein n=1 Tax=Corallincola luteus TaxID=1775177 RepID=A0ABY2ALD4_9GAMM|nr:alpha/beta fold hydrolase [Corallincola luteus]TCI03276.1 hypothetical protein EZV61_10380 [Corallincola luteus]
MKFLPKSFQIFIALFLSVGISGCNFMRLGNDLEEMREERRLISGQVVVNDAVPAEGPIILVRYQKQGENYLMRTFERLPESLSFLVILSKQPSFLIAIEDRNSDGRYNPGERYGFWGQPSPLTMNMTTGTLEIVIDQTAALNKTFIDDVLNFDIAYLPGQQLNMVGAVTDLNDLNIGVSGAQIGVWQPNKFVKTKPLGIFQLQPYVADKIPVLFVHGMGGYPEQFSLFIDNLDLTKFQPWVYSYPSGLRLSVVSYHLNLVLQHLHQAQHFEEIHIVAHSMGGLISRGALNRCGPSCTYGGSLTTIATPWLGHKSARSGVRMAPQVVPSWFDMQPESKFLSQLVEQNMVNTFDFNLAFAYRNQGLSRENSDGSVTLESQLATSYQKSATHIRGINATHTTILKTQELFEWWENSVTKEAR